MTLRRTDNSVGLRERSLWPSLTRVWLSSSIFFCMPVVMVRMVFERYSGHLLSYLATNIDRYVFWGSIFGAAGATAGAELVPLPGLYLASVPHGS